MNNFFIGRESQRFLEHETDAEGGFPIFERIALNAATEGDVFDAPDETKLGFDARSAGVNVLGPKPLGSFADQLATAITGADIQIKRIDKAVEHTAGNSA